MAEATAASADASQVLLRRRYWESSDIARTPRARHRRSQFLRSRHVRPADEDHLEYAATESRVLCTANRGDFMRLHGAYMRAGKHHAGIVLIAQQRYPVGEQLRRIVNLATQLSAEEMVDRAEYLVGWGS